MPNWVACRPSVGHAVRRIFRIRVCGNPPQATPPFWTLLPCGHSRHFLANGDVVVCNADTPSTVHALAEQKARNGEEGARWRLHHDG